MAATFRLGVAKVVTDTTTWEKAKVVADADGSVEVRDRYGTTLARWDAADVVPDGARRWLIVAEGATVGAIEQMKGCGCGGTVTYPTVP